MYVVGLISARCPGDKFTTERNRKFEMEIRRLEKKIREKKVCNIMRSSRPSQI